ncbi:hypothetical protein [Rhodovulum sp. YEN HP10]|uniref:hypothetical protein n=1 Tax=Rhodovulum sp. HP10 TaxID=3387397 RepID=UPI0039E123C1
MAKGLHDADRSIAACARADQPAPACKAQNLLADPSVDTHRRIAQLTADIQADAKANEAAQRLHKISGIVPVTASALATPPSGCACLQAGS